MTMVLHRTRHSGRRKGHLARFASVLLGASAIALSALTAPALADPFRSANPRSFDTQLEAAFDAMFEDGNYVRASELLQSASSGDPMTHAMQASLAFLDGDMDTLKAEAEQTLTTAQQLTGSDPLRGNLYTAVAHFMEGAHTISTQGTVQATPIVLNKLRLVFDHLNQAEAVDASDPELNLIKGYMDLMLAVNLPFSSPEQAIERLQTYAGPSYLVQRGLAIAYRDLERYDAALTAVDQAMAETPDNPDLYYLKAQILRLQEKFPESLQNFQQALGQSEQLPRSLTRQIAYEMCRTESQQTRSDRNCNSWADRLASGAISLDERTE